MRNRPYIYASTIDSGYRYFGVLNDYFDGAIHGFGFWFFHVYWREGFQEWK